MESTRMVRGRTISYSAKRELVTPSPVSFTPHQTLSGRAPVKLWLLTVTTPHSNAGASASPSSGFRPDRCGQSKVGSIDPLDGLSGRNRERWANGSEGLFSHQTAIVRRIGDDCGLVIKARTGAWPPVWMLAPAGLLQSRAVDMQLCFCISGPRSIRAAGPLSER